MFPWTNETTPSCEDYKQDPREGDESNKKKVNLSIQAESIHAFLCIVYGAQIDAIMYYYIFYVMSI